MTKSASAPAPTKPTPKPTSLYLIGITGNVLAQAAAHIRAGYTFDLNAPIDVFAAAGTLGFTLKLGDPEAQFVEAAKTATEEAYAIEQVQQARAIEEAAARLVADRDRAAVKAQLDAKIAEQEAALKALKAAAAAN